MSHRNREMLVALVLSGFALQAAASHAHFEVLSTGRVALHADTADAASLPAYLHDAATCFACRGGKERQRLSIAPTRAEFTEVGIVAVRRAGEQSTAAPDAPAPAAGGPRAPPALALRRVV
jgi:hypothetical protein